MRIAFRVDASSHIGTGHVIRCLTLADHLRELGQDAFFIHRAFPDCLSHLIENRGFDCLSLSPVTWDAEIHGTSGYAGWLGTSQDADAAETLSLLENVGADLLVVDHYALDQAWEKIVRQTVRKVVVLDDLANRPHQADMLVDQTYGRKNEEYHQWVPSDCEILAGTEYALLKKDFAQLRSQALSKRRATTGIQRVLICMGGIDPDNFSSRAVDGIQQSGLEVAIDIMIGSRAKHLDSLKKLASEQPDVSLYIDTNDVAQLMYKSDLAIGAGGTTTWERCCLGLPGIALSVAGHQQLINVPLHNKGAIINLENPAHEFESRLADTLLKLDHSTDQLMKMSLAASEICDGLGAQRVANRISGLLSNI